MTGWPNVPILPLSRYEQRYMRVSMGKSDKSIFLHSFLSCSWVSDGGYTDLSFSVYVKSCFSPVERATISSTVSTWIGLSFIDILKG